MSRAKVERLKEILAEAGGAVVAYSGGADSAFLADVAREVLGARSLAVTAVSPSLAPEEREAAGRLARVRGWEHREVGTAEIHDARYRANEADRCAWCKEALMDALEPLARERGVPVILGTNLDDLGDHRPGQSAAAARGARSPLVEAGLTKAEVRALSRARGLPTWDKPASACLASRIAYGVEATPERLERIARAESFLRTLGLRQLRVRDHGDLARLEVEPEDIARLADPEVRARVAAFLRDLGFAYVTLDLEGFRSGSMNLLAIGRRRTDNREGTWPSSVSI